MLLQLATLLAVAGAGVSAVAVTYVASGPHQQYSSPGQPHLAQAGAQQQYLARPQEQAGAHQQYSSPQQPPHLAQAGLQQQYLARPQEQAGAHQQYSSPQQPPHLAQAGAQQQYSSPGQPHLAQAGAQQQYLARPQPGQPPIEPEDFDPNPQYQFAFDVKDDQFTNYQNRKEQREGDKISGSYSVVDSDGFIRTVKYTADPREGFKAEVTREPTSIVVKLPTHPAPVPGLQAQYSAADQPQQFSASAPPQAAPSARHDAVQQYLQASQASRVYSSLGQQTPQQFAQPRAVPRPQPSLDPQQYLGQQQQFVAAGPLPDKPFKAGSAGDIYHGYQQ